MEKTGTERKNKGGHGVCEEPRNRTVRSQMCGLGGPGRVAPGAAAARDTVLLPVRRCRQGRRGSARHRRTCFASSGEAAPPTVISGAAQFPPLFSLFISNTSPAKSADLGAASSRCMAPVVKVQHRTPAPPAPPGSLRLDVSPLAPRRSYRKTKQTKTHSFFPHPRSPGTEDSTGN